jgi:jumonji domain-containing protein 7
MDDAKNEDPIAELITNYNELNGSIIEELDEEPSPLEFMRFVARNTPFVVRGAAADWKATKTWTVDYLKEFLGDEPVNVAVTPAGYVGAPQRHTHPPPSPLPLT